MLSILLVDDEPSILLALGDALARAGHLVTRATNGAEALVRHASQPFDLVITAVVMPEVDGMTLIRRMKVTRPMLDVIVITAYADVSDVVRAFQLGADDYLTKPFKTEELLSRVERLDARRTQPN